MSEIVLIFTPASDLSLDASAMADGVVLEFGAAAGASGGNPDALLQSNRLSEFDTEQKRADARSNLGVQNIDLGTFN